MGRAGPAEQADLTPELGGRAHSPFFLLIHIRLWCCISGHLCSGHCWKEILCGWCILKKSRSIYPIHTGHSTRSQSIPTITSRVAHTYLAVVAIEQPLVAQLGPGQEQDIAFRQSPMSIRHQCRRTFTSNLQSAPSDRPPLQKLSRGEECLFVVTSPHFDLLLFPPTHHHLTLHIFNNNINIDIDIDIDIDIAHQTKPPRDDSGESQCTRLQWHRCIDGARGMFFPFALRWTLIGRRRRKKLRRHSKRVALRIGSCSKSIWR
jgi:hypothetical protein